MVPWNRRSKIEDGEAQSDRTSALWLACDMRDDQRERQNIHILKQDCIRLVTSVLLVAASPHSLYYGQWMLERKLLTLIGSVDNARQHGKRKASKLRISWKARKDWHCRVQVPGVNFHDSDACIVCRVIRLEKSNPADKYNVTVKWARKEVNSLYFFGKTKFLRQVPHDERAKQSRVCLLHFKATARRYKTQKSRQLPGDIKHKLIRQLVASDTWREGKA